MKRQRAAHAAIAWTLLAAGKEAAARVKLRRASGVAVPFGVLDG